MQPCGRNHETSRAGETEGERERENMLSGAASLESAATLLPLRGWVSVSFSKKPESGY